MSTPDLTDAPEVHVRRAGVADLDAVAAFGAAVVPAHYEPILGAEAARRQVDDWWTTERLAAAQAAGDLHLVEQDGRVVGVAEVGTWQDEPVLWKLYVHPDVRGRGVGPALLRAVVAALPAGTERLLLEHFAGNTRAAAFYEREGFTHLRTDPAPDGDPAAATVWLSRPT